MKKILLAIVCMVSGLCGCSESDSDNGPKGDSISLSKDLISLDFEGGTDEIVVTSSGDWRMSGTSTWAHPSVTEGKSGDTVVFTIDPNTTDRNLQSEFKLFTGSAVARLTVTCGEGYVLSLDSDAAVSVLQSGGEFSVKLATNIPQEELTCSFSDGGDSWIGTPEFTDVFGDLLLTFTASENSGYSERESVVTISGQDLSVEVAVSQRQSDFLNVKGDKVFEFNTLEAATFSVEVESNIAYTVTTPDWITYEKAPATRAQALDLLTFQVAESTSTRVGSVVIADTDKRFEVTLSVRQLAPGVQMISIPDKNFRKRLAERKWIQIIDEESPEVIPYTLDERKQNDKYYYYILRANDAGIKSFEGVGNFPWVTQCNMGGNPELESVDISGLEKVTVLDLSGDTKLSTIVCGANACRVCQNGSIGVELITISGSAVTTVEVNGSYSTGAGSLKELDVTQCPALTSINAAYRDLLTTIYITAEQEGKISLSGSSAEFVVR